MSNSTFNHSSEMGWNSSECGKSANMELVESVSWWISGIITLPTAGLGILGNIISVIVLCKKSMKNLFHHLLAFLCLVDIIFLISNLVMVPLAFKFKLFSWVENLNECACHFSLAASVFLTLAITFERYQVQI
ncbi:FMRFamide receptor-like [Eurytemora carolleeae]|uniref:FMRFamide receptor-like n=1 Tax=Eurytemora carolleeae TaxID=1294199 RepID=UPI000C75B423|nr:FMRFamide receptor-like [Eurytemora carolleeae]|eukprot:XP_023338620.1 FMRFamide receptor-like [Eurytemora affinis]